MLPEEQLELEEGRRRGHARRRRERLKLRLRLKLGGAFVARNSGGTAANHLNFGGMRRGAGCSSVVARLARAWRWRGTEEKGLPSIASGRQPLP